jgi:hypothetical protein
VNADAFAEHIRDALETGDDAGVLLLRYVRSYSEAGMLTRDAGLVVRTEAGDEFQVTVVQVRRGDDGEGDA